MFSQARFPLALLLIMALTLPGLLYAEEKQPPTPASAEVVEMEFEVKKRELACQMAELGVEEAKISLDRARQRLDANVAGAEDREQAALHVKMRQLAAEAAGVTGTGQGKTDSIARICQVGTAARSSGSGGDP